MLEDFIPKNDKPPTIPSNDKSPQNNTVVNPETVQQPSTPPAGPYRPSVLNQKATQELNTIEPQDAGNAAAPSNVVTEKLPIVEQPNASSTAPAKKSFLKSKKMIFLIILSVLAIGLLAYWLVLVNRDSSNQDQPNTTQQSSEVTEETSKLFPANLSGLEVDPDIASRPVTAIMIENSGEARPQSGLTEADLVFEAIAEGGITRFLAMYQSKSPDYIGPIRSARPYYVEWAKTFDASYVHAGGSPEGLQTINALGVKDVNAFSYGEDVFFRTSDRQSPHNLYSSFKGLDKVNKEKGFTTSEFNPWSRKNDVPQSPTARKIDITMSSDYYNPYYSYDEVTNSYLRSQGGEAHSDDRSGKQISPKTVLVMVMSRSQNGIYSVYKTSGSGKFFAFQDGIVSEGTWSRDNNTSQYNFKDANGFNFLFNKGQTWISVVSEDSSVKYSP